MIPVIESTDTGEAQLPGGTLARSQRGAMPGYLPYNSPFQRGLGGPRSQAGSIEDPISPKIKEKNKRQKLTADSKWQSRKMLC